MTLTHPYDHNPPFSNLKTNAVLISALNTLSGRRLGKMDKHCYLTNFDYHLRPWPYMFQARQNWRFHLFLRNLDFNGANDPMLLTSVLPTIFVCYHVGSSFSDSTFWYLLYRLPQCSRLRKMAKMGETLMAFLCPIGTRRVSQGTKFSRSHSKKIAGESIIRKIGRQYSP